MNYKQAISWLDGFQSFGIKLELKRIKHLCEKLNNPQNNYKIIHVAGTNAKGSVCRYLHSILVTQGYTTGIYTSPHLQRFSERIVIDKKEISEKEIISLIKKIKPIVEEMTEPPTYFEIVTAMAFLYFSNKKVQYAIIEVGLGGRFDATNIINPLLTIITNISKDHQDKLGSTIEKIAFEKAGIIKDNVPVITGVEGIALKVIEKISKEKNAPLTKVDKEKHKRLSASLNRQKYQIQTQLKQYTVYTSLLGDFQGENIGLVITSIETLQKQGVKFSDENIIKGIKETINPGRMEIVSKNPTILLDGAHNIHAIKALVNTIKKDFTYEKLILIFGVLSDKNVKDILELIVPIADEIILTQSKNARAMDAEKLNEMIKNKKKIVKKEIKDAIKFAKKTAQKNDLICITGSLFTVGEAKKGLK